MIYPLDASTVQIALTFDPAEDLPTGKFLKAAGALGERYPTAGVGCPSMSDRPAQATSTTRRLWAGARLAQCLSGFP